MRQPRMKEEGVSCVYHCISRIVGAAFLLEGDREKEVLRNQIWKVADFCGVKAPPALAGHSLRPLLEDPSKSGKPAAFTLVTRGPKQRGDSIRTERWRYTEWSDGRRELYDHDRDPEEFHNVADQHPEVVKQLTAKLHSH